MNADGSWIFTPRDFLSGTSTQTITVTLAKDQQTFAANGNFIHAQTRVTMTDGRFVQAASVSLAVNNQGLLSQADGRTELAARAGTGFGVTQAGNDEVNTLLDTTGSDQLQGCGGNDFLFDDRGNDMADGGTRDDMIYTGADDDLVLAGPGNDAVFTSTGTDVANGGDGDDMIGARAGAVQCAQSTEPSAPAVLPTAEPMR